MQDIKDQINKPKATSHKVPTAERESKMAALKRSLAGLVIEGRLSPDTQFWTPARPWQLSTKFVIFLRNACEGRTKFCIAKIFKTVGSVIRKPVIKESHFGHFNPSSSRGAHQTGTGQGIC